MVAVDGLGHRLCLCQRLWVAEGLAERHEHRAGGPQPPAAEWHGVVEGLAERRKQPVEGPRPPAAEWQGVEGLAERRKQHVERPRPPAAEWQGVAWQDWLAERHKQPIEVEGSSVADSVEGPWRRGAVLSNK